MNPVTHVKTVCVGSVVIIDTRKHFEVTNMYKLFCHRKCTVAAAYNLSVYVLQLCSIENNNGRFLLRTYC